MLVVSDSKRELSRSFIRRRLLFSNNIELNFDINVLEHIERDICIALFASDTYNICAFFLTPAGGIRMRVWHYELYPSSELYPFDSLYPVAQKVFPDTYPGFYPTVDYKDVMAMKKSGGKLSLSISLRGSGSYNGEVEVYVEKGSRSGIAFVSSLFWTSRAVERIELGCVYARDTAYHLQFPRVEIRGEVYDEYWYHIKGYDGLEVADVDRDILWQGANNIPDITTYSDYTDIRNLARYDYGRPQTPLSTDTITWGSQMTFLEIEDDNFLMHEFYPNGINWSLV